MTARDDYPWLAALEVSADWSRAAINVSPALDEIDRLRKIVARLEDVDVTSVRIPQPDDLYWGKVRGRK